MCYCGRTEDYMSCCGLYLELKQDAPDPEALMRSRYTAFVKQNMDYIIATHDPQTRDQFDLPSNSDWARSVQFTGLEVLRAEVSGTKGVVEFRARFQDLKTLQSADHHEISKFRKQKDKWYFREGKIKK